MLVAFDLIGCKTRRGLTRDALQGCAGNEFQDPFSILLGEHVVGVDDFWILQHNIMAPRTRSATTSPVKRTTSSTAAPISTTVQEPRKLLLLPADLSLDARLVLLPHPRDGSRTRFLFCPNRGLFEFASVATPPTEYRSILIADESVEDEPGAVTAVDPPSSGYINKDAQLLVATPLDVLFLLLPLLPSSLRSTGKILFQPLDDLLEAHMSEDKHLQHVFQHGRALVEVRLKLVCDTVDAGDEVMFRLNEDKVLQAIVQKVQRVVQIGLSASLEDRFVTRALETPVLSVKREVSSVSTTIIDPGTIAEDEEARSESFDSQSTAVSSAASTVFSEVSVASSVTTITPYTVTDNIKHLQRYKTVLDFILASYLPASLAQPVRTKLLEKGLLGDFTPLDKHLQHLATLRAEAAASRSLSDFSRKRGNADDDEAAEDRAEKKSRLDEEEKRKKAGESRGVRDLKKVNVTGMKKMSAFFTKKPAPAKAIS